ncbi:hypothetical protein AQ730_06980 [Burkholderia pseudomallei]|nr:hypothetical protein AQ730_06980 [Burkholderia pseudomallei]TOZ66602.1 hypothetical protein DIJ60_04265 [Burkholderia pseudomallei]
MRFWTRCTSIGPACGLARSFGVFAIAFGVLTWFRRLDVFFAFGRFEKPFKILQRLRPGIAAWLAFLGVGEQKVACNCDHLFFENSWRQCADGVLIGVER